MTATTLTRILQVDAGGCAAIGVALVAAGGWLAAPLGLDAAWPVRLAGLAFVVYAAENLWVARRPTRGGLTALATVDVAFGVAVLAVAAANPAGAEAWGRWALAVLGDVSLVFGIAKLLGLRSLRQPAAPQEVSA